MVRISNFRPKSVYIVHQNLLRTILVKKKAFQVLILNLELLLLKLSRNTVLLNYILIFDLQSEHQPDLKIKIQRLGSKSLKVFKSEKERAIRKVSYQDL